MTEHWPAVGYDRWGATCDTLHAHTQVLGKLAVELARPEPELLHAALRLTARGWETGSLPAPDGSGSLVVALDLHAHVALVEHSRGSVQRVPPVPDRPVAEVTRDVLAAVARAGGAVRINPVPQEVPWSVPLDQDYEHARYDPGQVEEYFAAATQAALALAAFRAPYRGRSTPVNALEEAMRRLVAGGLVPDRAGQPAKVVAHVSLADLLELDADSALLDEWAGRVRARWAGARAALPVTPGDGGAWLDGEAARAFACDASVTPVVTGEVDPGALEDLVRFCAELAGHGPGRCAPAPRPRRRRGRGAGRDHSGRRGRRRRRDRGAGRDRRRRGEDRRAGAAG